MTGRKKGPVVPATGPGAAFPLQSSAPCRLAQVTKSIYGVLFVPGVHVEVKSGPRLLPTVASRGTLSASPMAKRKAGPPAPSESGPVTLRTLADHLGLSPASVSLVLNQAPGAAAIPRATQERIVAAARKFNYRPNTLARSLRRQRSFTIGVLVPEISEGYATLVLRGIEDRLLQEGFLLLRRQPSSSSRSARRVSAPAARPRRRGPDRDRHAVRAGHCRCRSSRCRAITTPRGSRTSSSITIAPRPWR